MKALLLLFIVSSLIAQQSFNISELDINRNLESLQVNALKMDQDGYLWIGTANGLYRYDGYVAKRIQKDLPNRQLRSTHILSIQQSNNRELLIGTDDGFSIYNLDLMTFENHSRVDNDSSKLIDNYIHNVIQVDDALWIATDGGLSEYHMPTKSYRQHIPQYQGSNITFHHIKDVFRDSRNQIWVGTTRYLNRQIEGNQFENFQLHHNVYGSKPFFHANRINRIMEDSQNRIWLSTDYGISVIDSKTGKLYEEFRQLNQYFNSVPYIINTIKEINPNTYLLGSESGLLKLTISGKTFELSNILNKKIYSLERYGRDIIWLGSDAGVYKMILNPENVVSYVDQFNTAKIHSVYCINEKNNELWLGTDKGIYRNHETPQFIYNQNNVKNIIFQHNQTVWFSGLGHELAKVPLDLSTIPKTVTLENEDGSIFMDNHFMDGFYDQETGKIWFAAFSNGLTSLNVTTHNIKYNIHSEKFREGLSSSNTKTIVLGKDRTILIGTAKGINTFSIRDSQFKSYFNKYDVRAITQDDEYIWIGTLKQGLIQTDHDFNLLYHYKKDNGLASNHIVKTIRINSEIWVLTNRGLNNIHLPDQTIRRFNYSHPDFLEKGHEFYTMYLKSDGDLYVGSNQGLYSFTPSKLTQSFSTPFVNITDIQIQNKSVDDMILNTNTIELEHDQATLSFSFSCTDYYRTSDNIFRYQLVGLDNNWIEVGNRNFVSYQNIPSGDYVFQVQAANHYGIWSENTETFAFTVLVPFWYNPWFLLLCLIVFSIVVYLFLESKKEKRREIERIRNKIATDLHDQIGSTLTEITLLSEMAQMSNNGVQPQLEKIEEKSRHTIAEMGDLVWAINSDKDTFEDLINRSKEFILNIFSYHDIGIHFDIEQNLNGKLKPKFRQNVYLMIKEIIHNIVKHSNATQVQFKMTLDEKFQLDVIDNGRGIQDPDNLGNGLLNLRKRAKELNGLIEFENDKGLKVSFCTAKSEV